MSEFKERPAGFDGEFFDLLFNSAEINNFAPEEKIKYHNDMTTERDIQNQIACAEQKGFEEGLAEGKAKGLAEGEAKGKAEGEANARLETARNMLADGLSPDIICKYTGLAIEEIQTL